MVGAGTVCCVPAALDMENHANVYVNPETGKIPTVVVTNQRLKNLP